MNSIQPHQADASTDCSAHKVGDHSSQRATAAPDRTYGPRFWATYVANTALMVAVSLLFRYADFVFALGGSEDQLEMITGLGMIGGIIARCFSGVAIDGYGANPRFSVRDTVARPGRAIRPRSRV